MNFQYFKEEIVNADIEITTIGNCCIEAFNDKGETFYLCVRTQLGRTEIVEYGPIIVDSDELPDYFNCSYQKCEYNDMRIKKTINGFLNNTSRKITQAFEISEEDFRNKYTDVFSILDKRKLVK